MNKIVKILLDIIFPIKCVKCGREGEWVCGKCVEENFANISIINKTRIDNLTYVDQVFYFFDFNNEIIPKLIHCLKYKYAFDVARFLANITQKALHDFLLDYDNYIFVPIPLNKKRYNERGFNQSEIILKELKKYLGEKIEIVELLKRTRNTEHQARLKGEARDKNLKNAFCVNEKEFEKNKNCNIFLFDDVVTTGNTFDECAKQLRNAGLTGRINCLAIAGQN